MQTFRDLNKHFGSTPAPVLALLSAIDRAAGRQEAYARQHPEQLESLRLVALVQSAEASNAIENIHAPRKRIEELVKETTEPANRSEQEIAGYRYVLDVIHGNALDIDFEPKFVEQLHGYMARYTGDQTAGHWKKLDNLVEEQHPDGTKVVRFTPISAAETPAAMDELHAGFNAARAASLYHHLLLTAGYVLDFLVVHPFRDGNGRMSRLISLWLLYLGEYNVGRYISLEKLVDESRETYYEALERSTQGWHEGEHDLRPWVEYFLGVIAAAYTEFEQRTEGLGVRGSKRALVERHIASSLTNEFTFDDLRRASPSASDSYIRQILQDLKDQKAIQLLGKGKAAKWRRLRTDFVGGQPPTSDSTSDGSEPAALVDGTSMSHQEREDWILRQIDEGTSVTHKWLITAMGLSSATVYRTTKALVDEQEIRWKGSRRDGAYERVA